MGIQQGRPLTPEIAAQRPEPPPAPPPRGPKLVARAPGPFRMKVSCVNCHDVFMDDVVPGTIYVCADCIPKITEEIKTCERGRLELMPYPAAAIDACIRVTKLESDDVLLLRLPRGATPEVIQDITTKLSASKIRCVVLADDVDVEVIRPSPAQETASE